MARFAVEHLFQEAGFEHFKEAVLPVVNLFLFALAAGFEMLAKFGDGGGEVFDAAIFGSDSADYRRMPAVSGHDKREHGVELFFEAVGPFAIGFVEDKNVADLHEASFHVLDVISEAGDEHDEDTVGETDDIDFVLTNADGFDEDLTLAGGVEEKGDFGGGTRESAEKTAGGHGADEDAVVAGVTLHAYAITEYGAAGVRAGGIDGDDANGFVALAVNGGEPIDDGAFAGPGGSGYAGEIGMAGVREKLFEELFGPRGMIFDSGDGTGDGTEVTLEDFVGGRVGGSGCHLELD